MSCCVQVSVAVELLQTQNINCAATRQGMLSFAGSGRDSRSCHMFITLAPKGQGINPHLGAAYHETAFAMVVYQQPMGVLDRFYMDYGDRTLGDQGEFAQKGLVYMHTKWPMLDRILKCARVESHHDEI